jgi:gluconate 2-dehydrogenase gamma chain
MSDVSRRDLVRIAVTATTAAAAASAQNVPHVHPASAAAKPASGPFKPKAFNDHEYRTIQKLAELIVPADEVSGSALEGGAPEYIDLLSSNNPELAAIYTGGVAWLDREMQRRYQADFVSARAEQQTAMLDLIAYRKNDSPELGPGIRFFDWARRMVVDAFYTSKAGIKDVGYLGNKGMSKFEVPKEAIDYALKRSPV